MIFAECLLPKCKCLQLFTKSNKSQQPRNVTKNANPAVVVDSTNLFNLSTCNLECQEDCLSLKKFVPVPVLLQCVRQRCQCNYGLGNLTVQEQWNQTQAANLTVVASVENISTNVTQDVPPSVAMNTTTC